MIKGLIVLIILTTNYAIVAIGQDYNSRTSRGTLGSKQREYSRCKYKVINDTVNKQAKILLTMSRLRRAEDGFSSVNGNKCITHVNCLYDIYTKEGRKTGSGQESIDIVIDTPIITRNLSLTTLGAAYIKGTYAVYDYHPCGAVLDSAMYKSQKCKKTIFTNVR